MDDASGGAAMGQIRCRAQKAHDEECVVVATRKERRTPRTPGVTKRRQAAALHILLYSTGLCLFVGAAGLWWSLCIWAFRVL